MKLSVIIPYYNGEKWISTCLDSLLNQDLREDEYEIIVVDDGSTHSLDVLKTYANKHTNIRYVRQNNARHSAARNHGLRLAQGEYVFFCDCDDFIAPNVLGKIIDIALSEQSEVIRYEYIIQKANEAVAFPVLHWEDFHTYRTGIEFINTPPHQMHGGPCQFFIKRSLLEQHRLRFDEKMWMREDCKFYLNLMAATKRVTTVNAQVYYYVQHSESFVHLTGKKNNNIKFVDDIIHFLEFEMKLTEDLKRKGLLTESCENKFKDVISEDAFIALHNTFRYADFKRNKEVMRCLQGMQLLPLQMRSKKHDLIIRLMNRPILWLILCRCFHILPKSIRYRYF